MSRIRQAPGFTLIEIAVVIVVMSLLLAMMAGIATAMLGQQRREATRQRLAGVETAIALFVSQNQRLPCPADGTRPGTDSSAGLEQTETIVPGPPPVYQCAVAGVSNSQRHGVVPWRTLGLSEQDVTDGWGGRLTFRVAPQFISTPSMNMTSCDPGGSKSAPETLASPGGYCDPQCSSANFTTNCTQPSAVTNSRGLEVHNMTGAVVMNPTAPVSTGAAYVVVSHGENRKGAYSSQGILQGEAWRPGWEDEERKNDASLVLAAHYVDDFFINDEINQKYFDDFLLRPSILTVATKAQLGPRAH